MSLIEKRIHHLVKLLSLFSSFLKSNLRQKKTLPIPLLPFFLKLLESAMLCLLSAKKRMLFVHFLFFV